jgi:DNA-binding beta-propeller fold protein YncE
MNPALCLGLIVVLAAQAGEQGPLTLVSTIDLGQISGRIDHLTIDPTRQRLFIAELGNDSVGVVDLNTGRLLRRLTGIGEPQGVAYVAATDHLYVASGADGSTRVFSGADLAPAETIKLGDDADNLRVDRSGAAVIAGYGSGALALIDTKRHAVATIPLHAHPESFQLSRDGKRAYVNVPAAHEIAVVDLQAHRQVASWSTGALTENFPMALNEPDHALWVAFRSPPRLVAFNTANGAIMATLASCGDSDDVFVDEARHRLYVICGSGQIEVWEPGGTGYVRSAQIVTASGARTGLFVPAIDRLFIAVRATATAPAAVRVYRAD